MLKKHIAVLGAVLLSSVGLLPLSVAPAAATTTGTLTIVASGGDPYGQGWGYNGDDRRIDLFSDASINVADIEERVGSGYGDLTLYADEIQINASLDFGSNNLTFKSKGSIRMPGGVTITATGGDILFQADSDDIGTGEIRLGTLETDGGSISSGGGDISLVGGSNLATGFARSTSTFESSTSPSVNKPAAGVALYGFDLNAAGGDITIRGSFGASSTSGTRSVLVDRTNSNALSSITTSGTGTFTMVGDGSSITTNTAWGIATNGLNITTAAGDIYISGEGNTATTNARGMQAGMAITSTSGNVLIEDKTDGSAANYSGTYVPPFGLTISTGGTATIRADEYVTEGLLNVDAASLTLTSYTGNSFTAATNLGALDLTGTPTSTFGNAANTANLVVSGIATTDGNVVLNSTGTITQTAKIEALGLGFGSTAAVTLTNAANDVDVIAGGTVGSPLGNFTFVDEDGLEVGTVGSLSGLYSSGVINIATTSGDLSATQLLSTTATSTDSILLYADKDAAAGAAGDGNLKFTGSGSISLDATSRALLYSGAAAISTGLTTLVGGDSFTRTSVAANTSLGSISPSLGATGRYALYRTATATAPGAPTGATASSVAGSMTADVSWVAPASTGGSEIIGYKIEINDGNGWTTSVANTGSTSTSAQIADLTVGTSYEFRVSAINGVGTSTASSPSTALLIEGAPAPAPYAGPIVSDLNPNPVEAGQETVGTISGLRLETITEITVDGKKATILSVSPTTVSLRLPALTSGIFDLQVVYGGGAKLTSQDLVVVKGSSAVAAEAVQEAIRVVVTGFRPGISKPTAFQVNKLKSAIAAIDGEIVGMTCVGFTNGPTILPADPRVALERGKFICDYLKELLPGLPQKLTFKNTTNPSVHWRRAEVYFRVN